ncbi:MAG: S8 family peptidase, partial [Vicinamibacterales bacterium]
MPLLLALLLVFCAPAAARGDTGALDPLLRVRALQLAGRSRVIVEFKDAPDIRAITGLGGVAGRQVGRGRAADVDNQALALLAADPRVARVVHDRPAFATLERTGTSVGLATARERFNLTGAGIGVAIIDSGIAAWHDDLGLDARGRTDARLAHFRDFTQPSHPRVWSSDAASDEFGHGTHVAGIVAGSGYDSDGQRRGIAPGAHLIALKVLDGDGLGYISDVIAAIDYAVAVRHRFNIRVINLSVASGVFESYESDPLTQAARRAVDAGIVVVTSAGNFGLDAGDQPQFGGITSPGNAPWVITVGGASHNGTDGRADDGVARFSSRGPTRIDHLMKPDVVAYGVGIESLSDRASTLAGLHADFLLDGTRPVGYKPYLSLTGTSMAAPVVAGTVALMLEAKPSLTPNAVKAILQYTAEDRAEGPAAEG